VSGSDDDKPSRNAPPPRRSASLCASCRHVKTITSDKGSTFFLCKRSTSDARYPKYPPQPVVSCLGYES
jgi:hypothetical protein